MTDKAKSNFTAATTVLALLLLVLGFPAPKAVVAETNRLDVHLRVNLGNDVGQPYGSLWEAADADGAPMAGAGFLSACGTAGSKRPPGVARVRTNGWQGTR